MRVEFVSISTILECVAVAFDVTARDLRSMRRSGEVAHARSAACLLARELTGQSYPQIGRSLGCRDHTTIMVAVETAEKRCQADPIFKEKVQAARGAIIIIAQSELYRLLRDPDAVATAERVCGDPVRQATRISTLESIAMAVRLLTLEDVAGGAYQMLAHFDELAAKPAGPRADALRRSLKTITETLSSTLASLGYAVPAEDDQPDGSLQDVA